MKLKKGFTLVELLVVIAILAIILLIGIPIILSIIENAKKNMAINNALIYIGEVDRHNEYNALEQTSMIIGNDIDITSLPVLQLYDFFLFIVNGIKLMLQLSNALLQLLELIIICAGFHLLCYCADLHLIL